MQTAPRVKYLYSVVRHTDPIQFAEMVAYELSLGWECQGGVSMCVLGTTIHYAQAITRQLVIQEEAK